MSSHIVDGVMAISILPEIDSSLSTEELLSNPNTEDSKKVMFKLWFNELA